MRDHALTPVSLQDFLNPEVSHKKPKQRALGFAAPPAALDTLQHPFNAARANPALAPDNRLCNNGATRISCAAARASSREKAPQESAAMRKTASQSVRAAPQGSQGTICAKDHNQVQARKQAKPGQRLETEAIQPGNACG